MCIKPSEGLSAEIEELRTKDIQPDANSAAERALERAATIGAPHASNRDAAKHALQEPEPAVIKPKQRVEGREIQQDHAQYALTYGMMLGIRVTVSGILFYVSGWPEVFLRRAGVTVPWIVSPPRTPGATSPSALPTRSAS